MKNDDILDIVRRCKLSDGEELVQSEAYLFNRRFQRKASGRLHYEVEEIIVRVKNGIKVGGLYRMGSYDIYCVIDDKYQGQHIRVIFAKKYLSYFKE